MPDRTGPADAGVPPSGGASAVPPTAGPRGPPRAPVGASVARRCLRTGPCLRRPSPALTGPPRTRSDPARCSQHLTGVRAGSHPRREATSHVHGEDSALPTTRSRARSGSPAHAPRGGAGPAAGPLPTRGRGRVGAGWLVADRAMPSPLELQRAHRLLREQEALADASRPSCPPPCPSWCALPARPRLRGRVGGALPAARVISRPGRRIRGAD